MALQTLYYASMASCCLYAIWAGGRTERCGGFLTLAASMASHIVWYRPLEWRSIHWSMFSVDLVTLGLALWLALRSDRHWPLWFAAFCLLGVLTHLSVAALPHFASMAYSLSQGFWAYPAMASLAIGTWHHRTSGAADDEGFSEHPAAAAQNRRS